MQSSIAKAVELKLPRTQRFALIVVSFFLLLDAQNAAEPVIPKSLNTAALTVAMQSITIRKIKISGFLRIQASVRFLLNLVFQILVYQFGCILSVF